MLPPLQNIPTKINAWSQDAMAVFQQFMINTEHLTDQCLNRFQFNPLPTTDVSSFFDRLDNLMNITQDHRHSFLSSCDNEYPAIWINADTQFKTTLQYISSLKNHTTINEFPGFQRLEAVELNFQQDSRHIIRVYKNDHNLRIFTNQYSWQLIFKAKALHWRIFKDNCSTYNQDVANFYTGLATNNLDLCNKSLNNILEDPIWKKINAQNIEKAFKYQDKQLIEKYNNDIQNAKISIRSSSNALRNAISDLQEAQKKLFYLENQINTYDYTEVVEYLMQHPYIKKIEPFSNAAKLDLTIEAPILYYDEEYARMLELKPWWMDLVKEVFLERKYTLWTRCKLQLNLTNFQIQPETTATDDHLIGHPHVDRYACLGNHDEAIQDWLLNKDYIGCIEQIVAMAFNLNFTDGTVINALWETLDDYSDATTFQVTGTDEFISLREIERRRKNEQTETDEGTSGTSDSGSN